MCTAYQACIIISILGVLVVNTDHGVMGISSCSSLQSRTVLNFNMSASSSQDTLHTPDKARINGPSAWCANRSDTISPWIQASFGNNIRFTGVKVQGSKRDFIWVKKFSVEYVSKDGRWTKYGKVLKGNSFSDYPSGKTSTFSPTFIAHGIRVYPLDVQGITTGHQQVFAPCLRIEFYGCRHYARCPHPGIPRNGLLVKENLFHNGVIQYKCKKGFQLQGFANLTCVHGRWNKRLPVCTGADDGEDGDSSGSGSKGLCSDPGVPVNGGRHGVNFGEGETVQFFCQKKYVMFGPSQISCINGGWSGMVPRCRVMCRNPGTPLNGGRHGNNFAEGQSVVFFCHNSYDLIGIAEPMCIAGQWSSARPVCKPQANKCRRPKSTANVRLYGSSKQWYNKGDRLFHVCAPGYFMYGTGVRTCLATNKWSKTMFKCVRKSCGDPGTPDNGYKDGLVFKIKSKVYYYCLPGHQMHGSSVRECLTNGTWTGTKPQCTPVDCGNLPIPLHGAKEVIKTTYLSIVKFRCTRRGYHLIGSKTRECQTNGSWSGTQPLCKKKMCVKLNSPANGAISIHGNYTYKSSVTFTCHAGHVIKGNDRSVCLDDGTWSSPVPECKKIIQCPRRWTKYNDACYLFKHKTRRSQSWKRLKKRCEKFKSGLLDLHDIQEWNFVKRRLKSKVSMYAIGLENRQGGVWRWSGGGMVMVSKWDSSAHYRNSKTMCGVMQASNGLFTAVSCDKKLKAFICKKT